ncbi:MAG: hypothetical protein BroJett011_44710 [Chloroflexota bacterium]|nr:MAG: hypothetical protein BroJett011_44710 [Chloroflexota bacterium]
METIGPFIAAGLTLMVFSYIFGDNVLFKLASHIFVGVAVGYAILVVWHQVFYPALTSGNLISVLPALILCVLLIFKIRPTQGGITNALGSLALAFVLGVGAALAIGGALFGTLLPQTSAVANISLNPTHYPDTENEVGLVIWLNNIIVVLGTIGTFFYFTFAVRSEGVLGGLRESFVRFWAGMGRLMLIFTLGALFANTVSSRVALLVSRLQFLMGLFGG